MRWLLDTNACIALINGSPEAVRDRFRRRIGDDDPAWVSSVTLFELWYGVAKSQRQEANRRRLASFLSGPVTVLELDSDDARAAGEIRADLERLGTPIGPYDLLIAGQALRRGATLVTANVAEFARIPDLVLEDWASAV